MRLASVFTDNAVFQRDRYVPVWGEAAPRAKVVATLGPARAVAMAAASGRFLLRLPPLPAGGPYALTVKCEGTDESVVLANVMVGEVWLASGQSNMEYCLGSDWAAHESVAAQRDALSRRQEKAFKASLDGKGLVRCFSVPRAATAAREDGAAAAWEVIGPDNAAAHTAVGLWFAKTVSERLGVAVGILNSSYGGTIAEAWTSRAGLLRNPETAALVAIADATYASDDAWTAVEADTEAARFSRITERDRGNAGEGMGWAEPDFADMGWTRMRIPGDWIKQEIAVNGAVWARREVDLPAAWAGKDVFLRLGGVDKQDTTYFNGTVVGRTGKDFETAHWNIPRAYRVPGELVRPGRNVIAVRAYSFAFDGGFNGVEGLYRLELVETGEKLPIAGTWRAAPEYEIGRVSDSTLDVYGVGNPNSPSILFDTMLRPLLPYALRGAIWYQGESNARTAAEAATYRRKLRTMIEDWRGAFEQGDFPFIQVELANFRTPASFDRHSAWAVLRECQNALCRDLPEVHAASALGVGDADDIHPQDKKTVGERLAACAMGEVYHSPDALPGGPRFRDFALEGDAVRVRFAHAAGLRFAGGAAKGFFLADATQNFRPADQATIEGDSVVLRCSGMAVPLAVRYAWSDNPDGNLENAAGLPAGTFRTDRWEV